MLLPLESFDFTVFRLYRLSAFPHPHAESYLKLEGLLRISFVRGMDQVNAHTVYRREVHEEKYSTFGVIGSPDSRQSATLGSMDIHFFSIAVYTAISLRF